MEAIMGEVRHLGAVFPDRSAGEGAVEELRELGLTDEHLGVAIHQGDSYVFEEDAGAEVSHGIEEGIAIGAPLGMVAGMTLFAVLVPGIGTLGLGGVLAAGGITGALAGGFWGAYLGLSAKERVLDEEQDWEHVALRPGEVLVVVAGHGDPAHVRSILERHGGHLVSRPAHIG